VGRGLADRPAASATAGAALALLLVWLLLSLRISAPINRTLTVDDFTKSISPYPFAPA